MTDPGVVALVLTIVAPLLTSIAAGMIVLLRDKWPAESTISRVIGAGLLLSFAGSIGVAVSHFGWLGPRLREDISFGNWVSIGSYEIPAVLHIDHVSVAFSLLGATLTALVSRFSITYLHKEAGFARFFLMLGVFGAGTQLIAFAGALDLFFAGWEAVGISSALFIGFFHERPQPVRSAIRAFTTYRFCDVAFLIAIVATHELINSTRLTDLHQLAALAPLQVGLVASLLLIAAFGKSAQLPFSGWLVRAMEGPTPSSALFYGGVSIHAGLYLLLRTSPVLGAAPLVAWGGAAVGLLTAAYASAVARTHTDAKGALAHATLAQTGLILAEICLGLTTLALVHLVCHALLRAWQYLRAPNAIHDAHYFGHAHIESPPSPPRARVGPGMYLRLLHRFRLDDGLDVLVRAVSASAYSVQRLHTRFVAWWGVSA